MRKTALIQITVALILSLIAGVLVFKWMNARTGTANQNAAQHVSVIVAARDIARGEKLTDEMLKTSTFLKDSAPSGGYAHTDALTGRVAASRIGKGEAVTASRLVENGNTSTGVSTMIAPGKRAVAVKGNSVLGLSGFIRPGNHVDVLVTMDIRDTRTSQKSNDEEPFSKTVLENIKVIATGTELEPSGSDGETSPVDTYTLELTSEESEKLALAATRGTLHFALRNPAEEAQVRTTGVDVPKLMASLKNRQGGTKAPSRTVGVEIITGTERKTVRFVRHDQ